MDESTEPASRDANADPMDPLPLKRGIDTENPDSPAAKNPSLGDTEMSEDGQKSAETTPTEASAASSQAVAASDASGEASGGSAPAAPTFEVSNHVFFLLAFVGDANRSQQDHLSQEVHLSLAREIYCAHLASRCPCCDFLGVEPDRCSTMEPL